MIGSCDLIGAVHVEGESITHTHTHTHTHQREMLYVYFCVCTSEVFNPLYVGDYQTKQLFGWSKSNEEFIFFLLCTQ